MKLTKLSILPFLLSAAMVIVAQAAQAEVSIRFSNGHSDRGHYSYHRYQDRRNSYAPYHGYAWRNYPRYQWHSTYRDVRVVPQPVYVPAQTVVTPALSGDYGRDHSALVEKLARLRKVIHNQKENDSLEAESYERFINTLDGIERDMRSRAYDRGGNLSSQDFADLSHRLEQTSTDIEVALAQ